MSSDVMTTITIVPWVKGQNFGSWREIIEKTLVNNKRSAGNGYSNLNLILSMTSILSFQITLSLKLYGLGE